MPGYGLADDRQGLLPWSWAVDLLNRTRNHVVSTVRPDGRPHAMPVWGIWLAGAYCFSSAITSVKSENLKADARSVVTAGDGDDAVIVEGTAELSDPPDGFAETYEDKYEESAPDGPIWIMHPTVAFAFQATDDFPRTATRWEF